MMTRIFRASLFLTAAFALSLPAEAGCFKGAVVGGVAGHFAHHHAIIGAMAGCAIGHHMAVKKKREEEQQRRLQAHDHGVQGAY